MSLEFFTFSFAIGSQKLGQPVPESYLVDDMKSALPQQMQRNIPFSCRFQYSPVKARSVAACRVMSYCSFVSWAFHSASVFTTFCTRFGPIFSPLSLNSTTSTYDGPVVASASFSLNRLMNATPVSDKT